MKKQILFTAIVLVVLLSLFQNPALATEAGNNNQQAMSGFYKFFVAGGWLVWFVLIPMSLLTISLIIQFFLVVRRSKLRPLTVEKQVQNLLKDPSPEKAMDFLQKEGSFLSRTLFVGLAETPNGRVAMENGMAEMLEQDTTDLLRKIEWLNLIGNVAPMVGLFGTVWGMINAFNQIVIAGGQPEPADLAGGISIALVTTWWGLVVAIPALAAYSFLRNLIDSISAEIAVSAENLLRNIHTNP
jgi:biopolymer transport protein ExbB